VERKGARQPAPTVGQLATGGADERVKWFAISKQEVWKAYLQVKSNGGAASVDAESIEVVEQDLATTRCC
jgi:hypothetical protein